MTTTEPNNNNNNNNMEEDALANEAASLDGYFSDAPLDPQPNYPPLKSNFDNVLILSNLPKVGHDRFEKLSKVIYKLVSRIGTLASRSKTDYLGIDMPMNQDESTTTCGFCFVEYESQEDAQKALNLLEGYKFDRNHFLSVTTYERAQFLANHEEVYQEQPAPDFVEKPNPTSWLQDSLQRDEFCIRHDKETKVYWSDGRHDPVLDYGGQREKKAGVSWCDYYAHWSPKGSFLATLVPRAGVVLWSGADYQKTARFPAPGVEFVSFSPCESYLLTSNNRKDDVNAVKVFHIASSKLLRAFPLYPNNPKDADNNKPPPPFLWSHDDQYLARMGDGLISIYETPHMKLLDRRSLTTEGIHEFQWSPTANILAYWAPEQKNAPAHVDLIEIPSRTKLRQKNLFNVTKCALKWQNAGDYLAVKVTRHTKSKKTFYNNLELFRLNEPNIPIEMLKIDDNIMAFAWEPRKSKFAMIHAENENSTKVNVSIYDMLKKEPPQKGAKGKPVEYISEVHKVETLEGKQCNCLFWSPAGETLLLAGLGDNASGTLEFYNTTQKQLAAVKEHYRANQVVWDPSGRTVATVVSQPIGGGHFKFAMDNGYILWSFQGKQLHQESCEAFYQFLWRPREVLLSKSQIANVTKHLKRYEKQFDAADKARKKALYLEETKGKRLQRNAYRQTKARLNAIVASQKPQRSALLNGYDSDDEGNYVVKEVTVETILNTKEETVV